MPEPTEFVDLETLRARTGILYYKVGPRTCYDVPTLKIAFPVHGLSGEVRVPVSLVMVSSNY